jgi:hypothetical protein
MVEEAAGAVGGSMTAAAGLAVAAWGAILLGRR